MSLRSILEVQNQHLLRDIEYLISEVNHAQVFKELEPYSARVISLCDEAKNKISGNINDLGLQRDSILEDVLSNTQQVTQIVRLLSSRMVTPILRCSPKDRLSIKVISWLHSQHQATSTIPAVFTDGDCSIWPFVAICPVYFFPVIEQKILLYLPLYFHEFGHLLYRIHQQELNDLVQEFQKDLEEALRPPSQRSDGHVVWQGSQREMIVTAWYKWMQELFCDAIGFRIGGPAFLRAFSTYLSTFEPGDFYRTPTELGQSDHPISLLRMRLLATRAQNLGLGSSANRIIQEWQEIANVMNVKEDYHGFYDDQLAATIQATIDDMIVEAGARSFTQDEIKVTSSVVSPAQSPVQLVHQAWTVFSSSSEPAYSSWEREAIHLWLG